jgi:hypothetical protein
MKMTFEVRQIDAWCNEEEGWWWNTSYRLGCFKTNAKNEKKAFVRFLNRYGIVFRKNKTRITFDGDVYEIIDRKTKEPLFAAIPIT